MPALPPSSDFTDAATTEGEFKTAIAATRDYLAALLGASGTQAAALAALGSVFAAGVLVRTTATVATVADRGRVIDCSGTWSLSLPAAATAGAGFALAVANTGSGTITIDPDGAELIGGDATRVVSPGAMMVVVSTGAAWLISGATLTDSTSTTSSVIGASAKAVKDAWDLANSRAPASHSHDSAYVKLNNGHGTIGSWCLARYSGAILSPGVAVAGSTLSPCGVVGVSLGTPLAGTWVCMGYIPPASSAPATIFQRIA